MNKSSKFKRTIVHGTVYTEKAFLVIAIVTILFLVCQYVFKTNIDIYSKISIYIVILSMYIMGFVQSLQYRHFVVPGISYGNTRKNIFIGMHWMNFLYAVQTIICLIIIFWSIEKKIPVSGAINIYTITFYMLIANQFFQFVVSLKEKFGLIIFLAIFPIITAMVGIICAIFIIFLLQGADVPKIITLLFSSTLLTVIIVSVFLICSVIVNMIFSYSIIMKYEIKQ